MSIFFKAILTKVESRKIIKIPLNSSMELPTRGMVMVQGTINEVSFQAPLEPDGKGSHWFEVSDLLCEDLGITVGQTVSLSIEPLDEWREPEIPDELMDAIIKADLIQQWNSVSTKAKWDWLRWIRSTNNPATRQKRIDVTCSKLQKGDTRPCCFDRTRCTFPDVSKSGVFFD
jgi:hypothetical protein